MTSQRIVLDRTLCSGFGACAEVAPEHFQLGPDGRAELVGDPAGSPAAEAAAAACPMAAILLEGGGS